MSGVARVAEGDEELVRLLDFFLRGALDISTFERDYLRTYKDASIGDPAFQQPLGRAFLAVEAYDPAVTTETETVHKISLETMTAELREAFAEIVSLKFKSQ